MHRNEDEARASLQKAKVIFSSDKVKAVASCNRALALGSEVIAQEAYFILGCIYNDAKKFNAALSNFNSAIQLHEKTNKKLNGAYYYNRGLANSSLGLSKDAIIDFEKALAIRPVDLECVMLLGDEYRKINDKFNGYRCLIKELFLFLNANGGLTEEDANNYKEYFSEYNALEVLDAIKSLPHRDAIALFEQEQKRGSLIQKYYPPIPVDAADFYFKLATEFNSHPFFRYATIDLLFKVILTELKVSVTELTEKSFTQLLSYPAHELGWGFENIEEEGVALLLEQCRDKQTFLGAICTDEAMNVIMHVVNYRKFMRATESSISAASCLNLLFTQPSQDKENAQDSLIQHHCASK